MGRGELAGVVGFSTVLELGDQGGTRCGLGCADGCDRADLAVVVAEVCLRPDLDRLAVLVGLEEPAGEPSP